MSITHELHVGDVLSTHNYTHMGHCVAFYEVTRLVGRQHVELRRLRTQLTQCADTMSGTERPLPGQYEELGPYLTQVRRVRDGNCVRINGWQLAGPAGKDATGEYTAVGIWWD